MRSQRRGHKQQTLGGASFLLTSMFLLDAARLCCDGDGDGDGDGDADGRCLSTATVIGGRCLPGTWIVGRAVESSCDQVQGGGSWVFEVIRRRAGEFWVFEAAVDSVGRQGALSHVERRGPNCLRLATGTREAQVLRGRGRDER